MQNDWSRIISFLDGLLNRPLLTISGTQVTFATIVVFGGVLLVSVWVSRFFRRALEHAFKMRGVSDPGTIGVAQRLSHYAIIFIGLAIALQTIGLNLGALFAAGAFFAVAVAFAMQNMSQNFVSGLLLLMERSIKSGDVLLVEGQVVRITHIGLRTTVARTRDEEDLIIPNTILAQNMVLNYTLRDPLYRLRAKVRIRYDADVHKAVRALEQASQNFKGRVERLQPLAILTGFGDSGFEFELHVWIDDPWRERRARSALYLAVWDSLKAADIPIAFNQLDIHLDAPVVESLEALRKAG